VRVSFRVPGRLALPAPPAQNAATWAPAQAPRRAVEATRRDFSTDAAGGIGVSKVFALRASGVINTLEDDMSSKLSRRSLVTAAAALPALALPAVSPVKQSNCPTSSS
jgi:hypothetical protein